MGFEERAQGWLAWARTPNHDPYRHRGTLFGLRIVRRWRRSAARSLRKASLSARGGFRQMGSPLRTACDWVRFPGLIPRSSCTGASTAGFVGVSATKATFDGPVALAAADLERRGVGRRDEIEEGVLIDPVGVVAGCVRPRELPLRALLEAHGW